MERDAAYWFDQVTYDLATARAMFRSRRYRYAIFFCHLAVEKELKGLVAQVTGTLPPRTHDLTYLAERADLTLPLEHGSLLDELTRLAQESRYPVLNIPFLRRDTLEVMTKTERVLRWLRQQRKS